MMQPMMKWDGKHGLAGVPIYGTGLPLVPWHYQESPAVAARRAAWMAKQMQVQPKSFDPKRDVPWNPKWLYKHGEDPARRELLFSNLAHALGILASN